MFIIILMIYVMFSLDDQASSGKKLSYEEAVEKTG